MKQIILVPYLNVIDEQCSIGLKKLESLGFNVWRRRGSSAIDVARNQMVSESLHNGYESMLFIDSDISFDYKDALKLFERPEPVISGVYPVKGARRFTSVFDGVEYVMFGKGAPDSYPLVYAATGFLRFTSVVLRKMIEHFKFPLCDTKWGRGLWPFFQPMVVPAGNGFHYLGEDWSFSYRLRQMGIIPLADTSIRLYHWDGDIAYSWEEAGGISGRFESYKFKCNY